MNKKVWYISKYANISAYGADTRQANFCKEFAKAGHKVRLITSNSSHLYSNLPEFKSSYKDIENDGYKVTWVNTLKYSKATSLKRIISWFWFEFFVLMMAFHKQYKKPDVVIASSLSILSVLSGCFYKRFYKAKFIFEVRDIWPQTLIDLKGFSHKHPLIWLLSKVERLGYKYSDSIVGTMPGLKDHVENEVGLGSKVISIPQGINLDFYKENQKELSLDFIETYHNDAVMNGLTLDIHAEEKAVELFAQNIMKAGEAFLDKPMETPFIPSWNRVISAKPDILERLYEAVEADNKEFMSR